MHSWESMKIKYYYLPNYEIKTELNSLPFHIPDQYLQSVVQTTPFHFTWSALFSHRPSYHLSPSLSSVQHLFRFIDPLLFSFFWYFTLLLSALKRKQLQQRCAGPGKKRKTLLYFPSSKVTLSTLRAVANVEVYLYTCVCVGMLAEKKPQLSLMSFVSLTSYKSRFERADSDNFALPSDKTLCQTAKRAVPLSYITVDAYMCDSSLCASLLSRVGKWLWPITPARFFPFVCLTVVRSK